MTALGPVAALSLVGNVAILWLSYRKTWAGPSPRARPRRSRVSTGAGSSRARSSRWGSCRLRGGVSPVVAALVGASVMLLTRAVNPKRLYVRVDWTLLALFAGLFVVVAGVEKAGLAERLLRVLEPIHAQSVAGSRS